MYIRRKGRYDPGSGCFTSIIGNDFGKGSRDVTQCKAVLETQVLKDVSRGGAIQGMGCTPVHGLYPRRGGGGGVRAVSDTLHSIASTRTLHGVTLLPCGAGTVRPSNTVSGTPAPATTGTTHFSTRTRRGRTLLDGGTGAVETQGTESGCARGWGGYGVGIPTGLTPTRGCAMPSLFKADTVFLETASTPRTGTVFGKHGFFWTGIVTARAFTGFCAWTTLSEAGTILF